MTTLYIIIDNVDKIIIKLSKIIVEKRSDDINELHDRNILFDKRIQKNLKH